MNGSGEVGGEQVCTVDGQTYERAAIEEWFIMHDESPATGTRLDSKTLVHLLPQPSEAVPFQVNTLWHPSRCKPAQCLGRLSPEQIRPVLPHRFVHTTPGQHKGVTVALSAAPASQPLRPVEPCQDRGKPCVGLFKLATPVLHDSEKNQSPLNDFSSSPSFRLIASCPCL
jgi:hypothetical protein